MNKRLNRRGEFGWEEIAKIIIVLVALVILIVLGYLFKDKLSLLADNLRDFLRFST